MQEHWLIFVEPPPAVWLLAGHCVQLFCDVAPSPERYVPAGHATHAVAPAPFWNIPGGHAIQPLLLFAAEAMAAVRPAAVAKVPAAQPLQALLPEALA